MSIFGSRPDMTRIRALAARLGELPAELAACRDTCPICYPPAAAPGPVPCSGPGPGPAGGPVHVIEVAEGELLEGIEAAAKAAGVTDAVIVSLIGTADYFTISTPPLNDATRDQPLSYAMPAEMTGTGEITGGKPHLHVVMAVQGSKALAGHLVRAEIRTRSVRVYLLPVP